MILSKLEIASLKTALEEMTSIPHCVKLKPEEFASYCTMLTLIETLELAWAQIERMKCCSNCKHMGLDAGCYLQEYCNNLKYWEADI